MKVISLKQGNKKQLTLLLDGNPAFCAAKAVSAPQEIIPAAEKQPAADVKQRCFHIACRYLSFRPRSESELRGQLTRRGFDAAVIAETIARLKQSGLLDDAAFARFWQDDRTAFRPRSKWLTRAELGKKGVRAEVIEEVLATADDNDNAYRAARSKAARLPLADYRIFRQKLGDFLRRRGFSYEVIKPVVERVWQEYGGSR